jgi:hypothetical protein
MRKGRSMIGAALVTGALLLSIVAVSWADVRFMVTPKKLSKPGEVLVFVSGLQPEQEIGVRTMMGDVLSDVSYLVQPSAEKADKNGAYAGLWNVDKNTMKVMKPGNYTITLVDESGNTLASAEFMIEKAKKSKDK